MRWVGYYLFENKFSALNCYDQIVYNTLMMVNKFGKHTIERIFCLNQLTIYTRATVLLLQNLHLVGATWKVMNKLRVAGN